jgi:carboxypeptidase family protein/TonB-dependent receptor-like protein
MKRSLRVLAVSLPLWAAAAPVLAQVQTGSLLVRVTDERGGVVPAVSVTVSSPVLVTPQSAATDAGGAYRFLALPPGLYAVRLEAQGFQTILRENLVVNVGQTTPVDLSLRVAGVEESLTVTAESPVVDTTSANVSVTLSQNLLQKTPGGRDIWSLVEYKVPGLVTTRPDVGGAAGGLQGGFSARGTPNAQNVQFLNGINVGDPAAIGFTQFYYDYDAFEQIQVSTGAHDISVPSAGVFLNMVTKTGGDRWNGKAAGFWQSEGTQSKNIDQALSQQGFRDNAGAVDFISDANFQLGGPLVKDRLRLFTSLRDWRVHVNVPGFPEIEETNISSAIVNMTWQATPRNRVTVFASRQYYKKPNRGASATTTPQSDFNEDDVTAIYQALWNSVLRPNMFMDARVSYNDLFFPLYQKGTDQSIQELVQPANFLSRAAQNEQIFGRRRLQASANFQYFVDRALGGRHELRFGIDHAHAPTTTAVHRVDDLNLFTRNGAASTVQFFNSPVNSKSTMDVTALFVQDAYSVRHLTLTGGLRFERVEGYLPEQDSPPSQWFPSAVRSFTAVRNIPNWKTVSPRLSAVYDLSGNGKTALKGAVGRYYYTLGTGTPNTVNPNFNASETYAWNDLNNDLHFQAGERGALQSRAGSLISSFNPDIRRPYTDEVALSVDHELIPDLRLSVALTYRRERDNFGNKDVGVPFSVFSPITRVDNGRDGRAGTADDATITVYDQDRTTLGQNRIIITNDPHLNADYKGLEITVNKRFSHRWQMLAGYTYSQARVKADAFANPNQLVNSEGPTALDRPHIFKLTGTYLLPRDINLSANFRTQSGAPITRTAVFALTQGNVTVNVEPRGSVRLDPLTTLDARLSKTFRLGSGGKEVEAMVDAYNLLNVNTVYDVRSGTGRITLPAGGVGSGVEQQQFLTAVGVLPPRIIRLGASFRF